MNISKPAWTPAARRARSATLPITALLAGLSLAAAPAFAAPAFTSTFEDGVVEEARGDHGAALVDYRLAAERGEAAAQFALGRFYLSGQGVAQDYAEARTWFLKAASQDNPGAQFEISKMLREGLGGSRDEKGAREWLSKSASHGFASAQVRLAAAYGEGQAFDRDLDKAFALATQAADQGDIDGELELGKLYVQLAKQPRGERLRMTSASFRAIMDRVFGANGWRMTSGYRSPEKENELRFQGAGTVLLGHLSRHSIGTPDAPGAYDIVVANMTPTSAATRLLSSGVRFRRVFPEDAHGPQGPHLHVEPITDVPPAATLTNVDFDMRASGEAAAVSSPQNDLMLAQRWLTLAATQGNQEAKALLTRLRWPPARS